ncbi:MAG: VapE domain-containing protein [Candidatus Kapaibacterium sp.]
MKELAIKYLKSGISIIPTDIKTKQPYFSLLPKDAQTNKASWKIFQNELAQESQASVWFSKDSVGLAIILGPVSDNMELLDFDNHLNNASQIFEEFSSNVKSYNLELFRKLVIQTTQSGGFHVIYRCEIIEGNQKLATQENALGHKKTVIETRGEGGYALAFPTPGYNVIQNSIDNVPLISIDERDYIIGVCKSFNTVDIEDFEAPYSVPKNGKARPGDDFNERGDIKSILISHGWQLISTEANKQFWRRPGKNAGGISATFNYEGIDKLYVFSSNAHPFRAGTSYDKFAIYTLLEHQGDFAGAAKKLLKDGYGEIDAHFKSQSDKSVSQTTIDENGNISEEKVYKGRNKEEKVKNFLEDNYEVRVNLVTTDLEIKEKDSKDGFRSITDEILSDIWFKANLVKGVNNFGIGKVSQILGMKSFVTEYHPFKEYFNNLPKWDKSDHIGKVIALVTPKKGQEERLNTLFTKWIVAVVASAIEVKENHTAMIFAGDQGIGKTSFFANLVPKELKPYYKEEQIDPTNKDHKIMITNSFILNLDELDGITRGESHKLKQFMTSSNHDIRKPYGRYSVMLKRRASFCGSVNRLNFLNDATGSRRFFVVEAENIDYLSVINHNQLYAQALELLNNGFQYWLNLEEIEIINKQNEEYQKESAESDLLDYYFEVIDTSNMTNDEIRSKVTNFYKQYKFLSNTELLDFFKKKHPHLNVFGTNLGIELKKRGGERRDMRVEGRYIRGYLLENIKEDSDF